jgi:hypothetical protein
MRESEAGKKETARPLNLQPSQPRSLAVSPEALWPFVTNSLPNSGGEIHGAGRLVQTNAVTVPRAAQSVLRK